MYDAPYCSERMGENYGAGSTASDMEEFYGSPDNGDFDPEWVATVEREVAERSMAERVTRLERENAYLRAELYGE